MKIIFSPDKSKKETNFLVPFVASYPGEIFVLITGESGGCYSGIMINGNSAYEPFEYKSDQWDKNIAKPYKGKIEIECP